MDDEVKARTEPTAPIPGADGDAVRPVQPLAELLQQPQTLNHLRNLLGTVSGAGTIDPRDDVTAQAATPHGKEPTEERPVMQNGAAIPDGLSGILSDPAFLAKLPQMMAVLKPMLRAVPANSGAVEGAPNAVPASVPTENPAGTPTGNPEVESTGVPMAEKREHEKSPSKPLADCRDDLLLALKPFLSPERREAVDSILRISRLGQVLRQIR